MTPKTAFSRDCVILDACCVINLYATGRMGDIIESLPERVAIAAFVHEEEALHIGGDPNALNSPADELIELQPFVERGLLHVVSPESDEENQAFISFAAMLDDGEAVTGAIAAHRNWAIGSDDRRATRFFREYTPALHIVTTLEIVQYWSNAMLLPSDQIHAVLDRIRTRAHFEPGANHPLYSWWRAHTQV